MTDNLIPTNNFHKKNMRQFLGKINYYHKYIPESSKLLEPLHNLFHKKTSTSFEQWNAKSQSFARIKQYPTSEPVLTFFNSTLQYTIHTPAHTVLVQY